MPFYVYVIKSESTGRRYVGQKDNLRRRLAEHNDPTHNPAKYTGKHQGTWRLVHQEVVGTRVEALRRERWLKYGAGRRWLKNVAWT